MNDPKDLAEKIAIGREALGLSQEQLAKKAGVSLSTLKRIEGGGCNSVSFGHVSSVLNASGFDIFIDRGVIPDSSNRQMDDDELERLIDATFFGTTS